MHAACRPRRPLVIALSSICILTAVGHTEEIPEALAPWLVPQGWQRDAEGPILSLGEEGEFDDTHIFAPAVVQEEDRFRLWYCGARGAVERRVFKLGLATSANGRDFARHPSSPVCEWGDGKHSILTPTILRAADGTPQREGGQLRMWFSSTWFAGESKLHTLHESHSRDGLRWETPSDALLENVYAPTVLKTDGAYEMWFTDVSASPWNIRPARSRDGREWTVTLQPVLQIDQPWEQGNLFYPTVLRVRGGPPTERPGAPSQCCDAIYLMWYGSYWSARENTTALGFAVSLDGIHWHKFQDNPVLRPDPERPWESHYTTSQSVVRCADGSLRIWYASRKRPPFVNKYFAINTAVWKSTVD